MESEVRNGDPLNRLRGARFYMRRDFCGADYSFEEQGIDVSMYAAIGLLAGQLADV